MLLSPSLITALFSFASAALLTSILSVLKLTFQHGGTLKELSNLVEAVKALTERLDRLSEHHGEQLGVHGQWLARIEERVTNLAGRVLGLEGRAGTSPGPR